MDIILQRCELESQRTFGRLLINNKLQCWTLEDVVRDGPKDGQIAIPTGRFEIVMDFSPHFKRVLPRLIDVPDFEGICIQPSVTEKDRGCILVGKYVVNHTLVASQLAMGDLVSLLDRTLEREQIFVEVRNPETRIAVADPAQYSVARRRSVYRRYAR